MSPTVEGPTPIHREPWTYWVCPNCPLIDPGKFAIRLGKPCDSNQFQECSRRLGTTVRYTEPGSGDMTHLNNGEQGTYQVRGKFQEGD